MDHSLADVFNRHFEGKKFDEAFIKKLNRYHIHLSSMNSEHIQFFGSNLLGVNVLRYTPRDVRNFFDTVLEVDFTALERDIRAVPTIYHDNSISGDILNLTLFYIMHRFLTSPVLNDKRRERGAYEAALIFCYRCTFALTNNYFSYPVDPKVAQAAYANLSNKHLIKRLGTWSKLCDYRATRIVEKKTSDGKEGLNYRHLYLFNDDLKITSIIQDSQGRFKSVFSIYYDEFDKVHKDGASIAVTSATIKDADGDIVLKEKTQGVEASVGYIRSVLNEGESFIDRDLVTVVSDMNGNSSFKMILSTLEWMSNAYHDPKYNQLIDKFASDVVVQSMYYIEHNIPIGRREDLSFIMETLKNMFLSTRSTDPNLLSIRAQGEKIMKASAKGISPSLMKATRSAIILYIVLRMLVKNRGR